MRSRAFTRAFPFALFWPVVIQGQARSITLRDAVAQAVAQHPDIRAAEADVAVAHGELRVARTITYNPAFVAAAGPARSTDTSLTNYELGVSQTLELGRKRARRADVASLRLDAAEYRRSRQRAVVGWRAVLMYQRALIARERLATAAEADTVSRALVTAAQDRLSLGSGTQLELNVAAAAQALDRRTRLAAEREFGTALFELRAAIGAGVRDSIVPGDDILRVDLLAASLDSLVALALRRRSDFIATRVERNAAEAGVRLARAFVWPDAEIGFSSGREEDFQVAQFSISLPLPFWNRAQGATEVASASLSRARVAEDSAVRAVELEVRDAHQAFVRAIESRNALETQVIDRLTENLALALDSFQAGKISLFTYNTIRRDLVESRLAYLDALAESIERRYALALAIGEPWESMQ